MSGRVISRRRAFAGFAALVAAAIALSGAAVAQDQGWPALPGTGFISGRPAVDADVDKGDAIFVGTKQGKAIGKPLPIAIPQYGVLTVPNLPVIIVQAEEVNGEKLYGARDFQGGEYVVKAEHLKLLGTKKPQ
jgi:hypothetical protein